MSSRVALRTFKAAGATENLPCLLSKPDIGSDRAFLVTKTEQIRKTERGHAKEVYKLRELSELPPKATPLDNLGRRIVWGYLTPLFSIWP